MKRAYKCFSAIILCCFFCVSGWSQAGSGEITGLVTDPAGKVIAGAAIELVNSAMGITRSTISSTGGVYRFVAVPVGGTYTLKMQRTGFKAVRIEDISVSVGATTARDIRLDIGSPTETVTVASKDAGLVQVADSAVSTLVDSNIWQNMPLEVRSQNSFINLVAGAVPNTGTWRGAAVNGARSGAGNYMVEGVDNNDQGTAGGSQISGFGPGGAAISISPDAIDEYRVITNGFSAEYGRAGGFITDTVLKSGTNAWHGSLFEYNRIQALAAQSFFANKAGDKDSLVRNQFGGSFGGPIVKDKVFFFSSLEIHKLRQKTPVHGVGTTREFLDWVKSGGLRTWAESDPSGICMSYIGVSCPGTFGNSGSLGPIFDRLSKQGPFPLATSGFSNVGKGIFTNGLIFPVPVYGDVYVENPFSSDDYRISTKIDYAVTSRDQVSISYLNQAGKSTSGFSGSGKSNISPSSSNNGRGQNVAIGWTRSFSPTVANTFKLGYLRHRQDSPVTSGYEGIPTIFTAIDPMTVGFGMASGVPQFITLNQFQFQDHLSIIKGKHSFKFGGEYRRTRNGAAWYYNSSGSYIPYGIEDLVTDMAFGDEADLALFGAPYYGSMYFASASLNPSTGQAPDYYRGFRANEFAAYFQDDWRISPRLTINWGVRYEYFGPPHNFRPNLDSNFYFGEQTTPIVTASDNPYFPGNNAFYAGVATGDFQVRNNEIWNKDTNNFAPRLGLALDVLGNQKLVLRAGAGIMYDRIYNNVFENIRFNPPYFSDVQIGSLVNGFPAGALSTPGLYTAPFSSRTIFSLPQYSAVPNPRHMDQNIVSPYYEQFHLGLQWLFYKDYVFEPEYIATLGRKLLGITDINTFNGRTVGLYSSARINPGIGEDNYRNNNFKSNYNAMQLTVRKNYSAGFGFNAGYTWSKTLDNLSDVFYPRGGNYIAGGPMDTMHPMSDYGLSDFHLKHRFVATLGYDLPFSKQNRFLGGWRINSIITLQSGVPFSPYNGSGDVNQDGRYGDRVVYTGSGSPMNSVSGKGSPADGYFDAGLWSDYSCPGNVNNGEWCNPPQSRNTMTGPGYKNVDFSIQKQFKISEQAKLKLFANFFNLFNHTNFSHPEENISSPSFGRSTAAYPSRITQLAVRIDF